MKIVVIGTRGIPNILGGVETHCEELYPRLVALGHDVTILRRSCYINDNNHITEYKGVKLIDVYAPRRKSFEAIIHTFLAVIVARRLNPDILHIHAIGPSIMTPLARLLGMKVVMTNHGPDYNRDKWGTLARSILKAGEWCGAKFCNHCIAISQEISDIMTRRGCRNVSIIYNGVNKPQPSPHTDYISSLGIIPGKYILAIGRFVKEKGFHDLVNAYKSLNIDGLQLVIAGDADHPDKYSESLKASAREAGAILTGFIKGEQLNQVMSNALLFAMPSYHEGLPIALLEALSYDKDVVVSDIPANRLSCLDSGDFFETGNVDALARKLREKLDANVAIRHYDLSPYNWDNIAKQVSLLYNNIR